MIENIKVTIEGQNVLLPKGIPLEEIAKNMLSKHKYPIVLGSINGSYKELFETVNESCDIRLFDNHTRAGNRVYVNGLIFIMILAVKRQFGMEKNIRVEHSIDKGLYIHTEFPIEEEDLIRIKKEMMNIVTQDLAITKMNVLRKDAMKYFEGIQDFAKKESMRYNTNTNITLYRLGTLYNYFYSYMPASTGCLNEFDLTYINEEGFVLRFPTIYMENGIKPYEHHPNIFKVFREYRTWAKLMKLENVADLNKIISEGRINDLIRMDEIRQSAKLLSVAEAIYDRRQTVKIVLIAGPSSSGKTTTGRKLCTYLRSFGVIPHILSLDDYFLDREQTPKLTDGSFDYESLNAIDLALFEKQMKSLILGEKVKVPTYNFLIGMKEYKREMVLSKDDILIIEGIHGLNEKLLENISREQKFKIYLSVLTELNLDNQNRIPTTDNRLLRRIVRDNRTRGYGVNKTLENWPKVREGEEKYIFPYQDEADVTFNTALIYELGVLKTYVEPLLYSIDTTSPYYEEAKRLINFLRTFLPIPADAIAQDSILREFIGGSCFE